MYIFEYVFSVMNSRYLSLSLIFDWISIFFLGLVCFISSIVFCYSCRYIEVDKNINRFIILVFLFVFSILIMILSPSLIRILLGWDGLGLSSYCLVIYYQNNKSYSAGILTVLINRLGDVALLISISWIISYGSWNFYRHSLINELSLYIIIFVCLASFTKRAQVPFSSWLPAAIAAPTPVSSLVHSSTLVTAGVYLLIRFSNFLSLDLRFYLLILRVVTSFMAGISANYEYDLKKIIALSTLRQLGLIIRILFVGDRLISFFHLFTHALFKALLFICAGSLIHCFSDLQDIRYIGNLINYIPFTICLFNLRNFSLCGIPFISGFYSKDLILEFFLMKDYNFIIYLLLYISIGLTVSYTIRLSYFSIFIEVGGTPLNLINDGVKYLKYRIGLIALFVILRGGLINWVIFTTPLFICLPFYIKLIVLIYIFFGLFMGVLFSGFSIGRGNFTLFMHRIWNLTDLFTSRINNYVLKLGDYIFVNIDLGWVEYCGSQNFINFIILFSDFFVYLLNNSFKIFVSLIIILLIILILFCLISLIRALYWRYKGGCKPLNTWN